MMLLNKLPFFSLLFCAAPLLSHAQMQLGQTPSPQTVANSQATASMATAVPTERYGEQLGRLLTSAADRSKLDDLRFNVKLKELPKLKPGITLGPAMLQIDGISNRPDAPLGQRITIWIDGRAYLENALPKGLALVRSASGEVTGMTSKQAKNQTVFAKIGDVIPRPQSPEEAEFLAELEKVANEANKTKP